MNADMKYDDNRIDSLQNEYYSIWKEKKKAMTIAVEKHLYYMQQKAIQHFMLLNSHFSRALFAR